MSDKNIIPDVHTIKLNGITSIESHNEYVLRIKYTPEAITARQIAYFIEDKFVCKVNYFNPSGTSNSLVQQQNSNMKKWLKQFLLSLIFTLPIFILSMVVQEIVSNTDLAKDRVPENLPLYNLMMWIMATPVQFCFGARFYRGAYKALKHHAANMDVLVAMGTSAAYLYGATLNLMYLLGYHENTPMRYIETTNSFQTSSLLISIILMGKFIESRSKHKTTDAITKLANLQVSQAICIENGAERETDVELLDVGCIVKVYPGASVPSDGTVTEGEAWVNESMMTGESSLVRKTKDCFVFGGTMCNKGTVNVKILRLGKDTALAQIIALVESAQSTKPPIQAVADQISKLFVPAVILLAFITWSLWFAIIYSGDHTVNNIISDEGQSKFLFGFNFGISVLVIACPCALGLATPTAIMVATGVAAKYGILIKDGEALEGSANIKTIIFDKTGTLTDGKPQVTVFKTFSKKCFSEDDVHKLILAIEGKSEHAIAKAICAHINQSPVPSTQFMNLDGEGVVGFAEVNGNKIEVAIGNLKLFRNKGIFIKPKIAKEYDILEEQGKTTIIATANNKPIALIAVSDAELVKPEAKWVISQIQKMGLDIWIITGDNEKSALLVANYLNISPKRVLANCYPAEKRAKVEELQRHYSVLKQSNTESLLVSFLNKKEDDPNRKEFLGVMFVGDGVNDSPSLAQADIGITIGGTDIANEAASIVLLKNDLRDVLIALDLSRKALSKIKWNFFWAFIYNICGIPVAGGILYVWSRFALTSVMAAAAMACSSTAVVFSSLMLNRYKPPHSP